MATLDELIAVLQRHHEADAADDTSPTGVGLTVLLWPADRG